MTLFESLPSRASAPRRRPWTLLIALVVVFVLLVAVTLQVIAGSGGTQITAYFGQAVGVYPGSDLRVLGVKVGSVDAVRPMGQQVRVTMTLDDGVDVPAGADAVVVAPSIVADRYIQLSPAYTDGPKLGDHAVIPAARTATPVELDQLYDSISKLATALGPNGVNAQGALSDFLNTSAANLGGNGEALGDMIRQFGQATKTLSGSKEDLFATLTSLQQFTTMLKDNDGQVRMAEQQLAQVNGFLADDRQNLGEALKQLATALVAVKRFISDNRGRIKSNVVKLASITQVLVEQRKSLAEVLDTAPLAADNVVAAYDPVRHTLNGRGDLNELSMGGPLTSASSTAQAVPVVAGQMCSVTGGSAPKLAELCRKYQLQVGNLEPLSPQRQASIPPLPLPAVGQVYGSPQTGKTGVR